MQPLCLYPQTKFTSPCLSGINRACKLFCLFSDLTERGLICGYDNTTQTNGEGVATLKQCQSKVCNVSSLTERLETLLAA